MIIREKDGEVVGEVLQDDELKRTGTVDDIWSRIVYTDDSGAQQTGYIPTSCLEGYQETEVAKAEQEKENKSRLLTKSSGEGIFADAVDGVTSTGGSEHLPMECRLEHRYLFPLMQH